MSSKNSFDLLGEQPEIEKPVTKASPAVGPRHVGKSKPASKNHLIPVSGSNESLSPAQHELRQNYSRHHGSHAQGGVPRGREKDRQSGTGRTFENKKDGAGRANYGRQGVVMKQEIPKEVELNTQSIAVDVVNVDLEQQDMAPSEEKESVVKAAAAEVVEKKEDPKYTTFVAYMEELAEKKKEIDSILPPPPPRKIQSEWFEPESDHISPVPEQKAFRTNKRITLETDFKVVSPLSRNGNKNSSSSLHVKRKGGNKPSSLSDFPTLSK